MRREVNDRMRESDDITVCRGVGEKTAQTLRKMGIETVGDLLRHIPVRYDTFGEIVSVEEAESGQICAIRGEFLSAPQNLRTGKLVRTIVSFGDGTGTVRLTWFRMPYLKNMLHRGDRRIVRGKLMRSRYGITMEQPKLFTEEEYAARQKTLQPVYAMTGTLSAKIFSKILRGALDSLEPRPEFLPESLRVRYDLVEWKTAIERIHFPRDEKEMLTARRRLVFDEFLFFLLGIRRWKEQREERHNLYDFSRHSWEEQLRAGLGYELTGAQKRVWQEIREDLEGPTLMNRLIQGDVGSGKTVLAQLALTAAAENGLQGAIMAPTEVLAAQHYASFTELYARCGLPVRCVLLTGSLKASERRQAYVAIENHEADIVIGTHALIQEKVVYDNLALVVTDEQHRFGVHQREELAAKGQEPHILVMSATPSPRTLAIILYGDLDISLVDEMPVGRRPIKNCVVDTTFRPKAYEFLRKQVEAGHQAYVICPLVETSEEMEAENVLDYAEKLRASLPGLQIETLHGRMRPREKNARMEAFQAGDIQILVSTTVVEVGVNVPNATVMMIENAERFGLAQLHQLRGRVGRGQAQSYCIFIDASGDAEQNRRLQILGKSNDGFEIAAEDLKLRGPGDLFGIRQSGNLEFTIGDIYNDAQTLKEASEACDWILKQDLDLTSKEFGPLAREITQRRALEPGQVNL
ncbi:MAG: ATP-dependent DNA helicase RecG [Lachnospiraceae bacterium]|nr:ATP-dependent DNA helicase RecG [Lachnospiraceae bacterium]